MVYLAKVKRTYTELRLVDAPTEEDARAVLESEPDREVLEIAVYPFES